MEGPLSVDLKAKRAKKEGPLSAELELKELKWKDLYLLNRERRS